MKCLLIVFFVCLIISVSGAEPVGNIYWVQFNTKAGTPYSIDHPNEYLSPQALARRTRHHIEIDSTDLPVNPLFPDSLRSIGFYVKHISRWMNGAIVIYQDTIAIDSLSLPSFVSSVELRKSIPLKSGSYKFGEPDTLAENYYGNATDQVAMLNGQLIHQYSKGEGVRIAVIDAGFLNADKIDAFDSLYARGGVLGTFDFANPGNNVYAEHSHGTNVLSIMAANWPGVMMGTAPGASYWLLRTEVDPTENPVEEDYWIIAAEFADSVGCNIITTSLGYCTNFDQPQFNHNYDEFTGDSLRISKVANMAVKKGIVVVCSAGNEGNNLWHYIAAPSEARDVLSVAAVNNQRLIASFSSRGFDDSLHIPKPDVAAMGVGTAIIETGGLSSWGSGTSFSGPVIAGMAACLVALYPDSNACSIIKMIREAGDLYPEHSVDYGYGIPDFGRYLPKVPEDTTSVSISEYPDQFEIYPNPFSSFLSITNYEKIDKIELIAYDGRYVLSIIKRPHSQLGILSENFSRLSKGVYFARIWEGNTIQTIKLIKN